jgi:hypothetical protein
MLYKGINLDEYKGKKSQHFKDLVGKQFGEWLVIQRAPTSNCSTMFWCECTCGKIKKVFSTHLIRGFTKSCLNCAQAKNHLIQTYEDIPVSFWNEFKKRATGEKSRECRRKLKFTLTIEDLWSIYIEQNKKCALSGLDIGFNTDISLDKKGRKHHHKNTASIDRIDSKGNYELGNVQLVHKDVNRMKNIFDQNYFIKMCKLIGDKCELK